MESTDQDIVKVLNFQASWSCWVSQKKATWFRNVGCSRTSGLLINSSSTILCFFLHLVRLLGQLVVLQGCWQWTSRSYFRGMPMARGYPFSKQIHCLWLWDCVCKWVHIWHGVCVQVRRQALCQFPFSPVWVPGIKLRFSVLAAGTSTG